MIKVCYDKLLQYKWWELINNSSMNIWIHAFKFLKRQRVVYLMNLLGPKEIQYLYVVYQLESEHNKRFIKSNQFAYLNNELQWVTVSTIMRAYLQWSYTTHECHRSQMDNNSRYHWAKFVLETISTLKTTSMSIPTV